MKHPLHISGPLLPGSVSTAYARCATPNCICRRKAKPRLHGPYYRWTGVIKGRRTTKTITQEQAEECERRIRNYRKLQKQIDQLLEIAISSAPWNE